MKRIIPSLLALTLLFSLGGTALAEGSGFADVPEDEWYAEYVGICYEAGLMKGVGDGRFDPDGRVTIAQMMTVCARLHSIFSGGKGDISRLPDKWIVRFTDETGEKLAETEDIADMIYDFVDTLYITLSGAVMDRMEDRGDLTLRFGDTEQTYTCYYVKEGQLAGRYAVKTENADELYDLYDRLADARFRLSQDFAGEWYADTWRYLSCVIPELHEANLDAADEMSDIIDAEYPEISTDPAIGMNQSCPRAVMAMFLALCVPEEQLKPINNSAPIPDLNTQLVRRLYNAGIMGGIDSEGNFGGHYILTRAQFAAVIARVMEPELRLGASTDAG